MAPFNGNSPLNLERAFNDWYSPGDSSWYESEPNEEGAFTGLDGADEFESFDHRDLVSDDAIDIQLWLSLHSPDTDAPMDLDWQRSRTSIVPPQTTASE